MKIYIDPGHGGNDSGAVGNRLTEKKLNLDISLREKLLFERLGHKVKISRTGDESVSLSNRINEANDWGADIYISNHINAGGGEGIEVWHSIYGGKGKEYASKVEKNLSKIFKSRGLKCREGKLGDYLYVIRNTIMPAILVEFGFIDNKNDALKLKKEEMRQRCAEAVVYGIIGENMKDEIPKTSAPVEEVKVPTLSRLLKYTTPMIEGEDVKLVQQRLNELGFGSGEEDGTYGNITKYAVRRFQRAKGLAVDGIVGPDTWSNLLRKM